MIDTLDDAVAAALERAEAAERERDELKIEIVKLRQQVARHACGMLAEVWTPEKIVEWAEARK